MTAIGESCRSFQGARMTLREVAASRPKAAVELNWV
jgi:hypothetical protein